MAAAAMKILNRLAAVGIGMSIAGGVANTALYNVPGGHRAIIFDKFQEGIQQYVKGEGTHFVIPWVQNPILFDVRLRPRNIQVVTGSKDLQNVSITIRLLHRPKVDKLPWIYKNLGTDYDERVLPSIANEVIKAVVAQFDASELITQREAVSAKTRTHLMARAKDFNLIMDDISITHLTFGAEFTHAVELKQVAQQEAERARYLVEGAEQEQIARVIRAEGDSEAARLISKALEESGNGIIEMRKIDAAKEIAETLAGSRNVAYLPGGKNVLLNLGI